MSALLDGLIAGYGIAIPLGAISILIVNMALDHGFRLGFMAGAGTATIDMICAILAVFAGTAVVALIAPFAQPLQLMSGLVLLAMGAYGLMQLRKRAKEGPESGQVKGIWTTYGTFMALTALNPFTVVYFLALIMGQGASWSFSWMECLWFVFGVAFASLSWQIVLAGLGALAKKHLSPSFMKGSIIVGNAIVILLGIQILISI
ncbi:MAG: LysE family transporter [Methanomassiliicoccales archaeon]|nr:LysE family transporter [Methanomassiliicoccales archaeon]